MTRLPNLCKSCGDPCAGLRCAECAYEIATGHLMPTYLLPERGYPTGRCTTPPRHISIDEQGRGLNLDHDLEHLTEDLP